MPLDVVLDFVKRNVPKNLRATVAEDCVSNAERYKNRVKELFTCVGPSTEDTIWLPAETIRNLMVNYELSSGPRGVNLAKFYPNQGIGLSLDRGGMKPVDILPHLDLLVAAKRR